ncbi:hypothetical protein TRAPUB_13853 [Trametes pubescens]|uniref:DUF4218 domain-containing protein n=1 Tax=Trametes pubescens TaxID=154538 RepID=A0A1M2VPZ1_TRAPU|nr:hypothetical protein TRAPUB_13853 [Trametes pubescens]
MSGPTTDFRLVTGEHAMPRVNVLDQPTLSQIREDIVKTYLPSWLERPPRNFGSAAHGKLKADHWRTVCTVSMVITLVRLWGTATASAEQKALLENFVHLVCAVDLAVRRSVDPDRIAKFDEHMQDYLAGLRLLFEWHQFVPNNHLSLHLKECLDNFGPVHAWWAFPFERFNGLLQKLNTNSKSNSMPLTFMRYFYIGTTVRRMMETAAWPDDAPFKGMLDAYRTAFQDTMRGTRAADATSRKNTAENLAEFVYDEKAATDLPRAIYNALVARISSLASSPFTSLFAPLSDKRPRLSMSAQHVSSIIHNGLTFAIAGRRTRDSFVLFNTRASDELRAGQIQDIFYHVRTEEGKLVMEPFCVVTEYTPMSPEDAVSDPYRKFPDLQTQLYYNQPQEPALISMRDIRSHFAAYIYRPSEIGKECIVVRSLDRISASIVHPPPQPRRLLHPGTSLQRMVKSKKNPPQAGPSGTPSGLSGVLPEGSTSPPSLEQLRFIHTFKEFKHLRNSPHASSYYARDPRLMA